MGNSGLAKMWKVNLEQNDSPLQHFLRFVKAGLCLGLIYGAVVSAHMVFTVPLQTEAILSLTLIALVFAGGKGALIGMVLWLLFTMYGKFRHRGDPEELDR